MPVEEQVVAIFAGTRGYLDDIPVGDVGRFESELLEYFRSSEGAMLDAIRSGTVPDDLGETIAGFKAQFSSSAEGRAVDPLATDAGELGEAESAKTLATE
jgi:F-type H+-transporting ATPase subunit alpha